MGLDQSQTQSTLFGKLGELERRIRELETANRLVGAIPKGQSIVVLDPADGSTMLRAGVTTGGRNGIEMYTPSGVSIMRVDDRGALEPNVHLPFHPIAEQVVTSSTFTSIFEGRVSKLNNPYLHLEVDVSTFSTATGEIRLGIWRLGTPSGTIYSAVKSVPALASTIYNLYIQIDMNLGGPCQLWLESRVASGAGPIACRNPFLDFGDYSSTATIAGVWV